MKITRLGIILLAVPLLASVAALFFLPSRIPIHWNSLGQVDRYGSKYTILILAVLPFFVYTRIKSRYLH